jgi:hypothetical protein
MQGALDSASVIQVSLRDAHQTQGWWNFMWMYGSVAFANIIFQGLLNMHVLLDNPYGDHCCKFPLRAQVIELLNVTRTLLTRSDVLPSMFSDIFEPEAGRQGGPAVHDKGDPGGVPTLHGVRSKDSVRLHASRGDHLDPAIMGAGLQNGRIRQHGPSL